MVVSLTGPPCSPGPPWLPKKEDKNMCIFSLIPHPIIKNKHAHKKQEVQIPPTPKAIYIWFPFSFYAFCSSAYCQNQYMNHPFWLTIYSFPDEAVSSVQIDPKNEMRVGWGAALETWKHLRHQKPMHKVKWYSLNWFHFWHCIPSSQFYFFTHVLKSEFCRTILDFKSDLTEIGCDSRRLKWSVTVLIYELNVAVLRWVRMSHCCCSIPHQLSRQCDRRCQEVILQNMSFGQARWCLEGSKVWQKGGANCGLEGMKRLAI